MNKKIKTKFNNYMEVFRKQNDDRENELSKALRQYIEDNYKTKKGYVWLLSFVRTIYFEKYSGADYSFSETDFNE